MIQINLLPDVKQEYLRAKRTRNTVVSFSIIAGIGAAALVVVLLIVLGGQKALEAHADGRIKSEYDSLSQVEDLSELVTLQAQLESIGSQHDSKTMTSRLFSMLSVVNPTGENSVQFSNVSLSPSENTIQIEGIARAGYVAVEALEKTIKNTNFSYAVADGERSTEPLSATVSTGETALTEDSEGRKVLSFIVDIQVNPLLFSNQAKNVRIQGPDRQIDVTDSRVGVPESLFTPAVREGENE